MALRRAWTLCGLLAACRAGRGPDHRAEAARPLPLPAVVASLQGPRALVAHRRRAWLARYGPLRFAPDEPVAPETAGLDLSADGLDEPEVVVEVTAGQARIVTGAQGLRILIWIARADLVPVPTRRVALRASATAAEAASAGRVDPGFRFTSIERHGEVLEVRYDGPRAQFRGFVAAAAFGTVFEPGAREAPRADVSSRARSNAAILDGPDGRTIATLRGADPPYFEHDVTVVAPPQRGFTPIVLVGPPEDEQPVARYAIRGWVRSRELGIEPMSEQSGRGSGGAARAPARTRRVTIAAGTPLRRGPGRPIIGVAVATGAHAADPAPGGGSWIDVLSPWAALRVWVQEPSVSDPRAAPAAAATPAAR